MAYDIGPRIGIKGESEFNKQINSINQNLKVLGSEMKSVTSTFEENANSQDALVAKNKVLNQQLDTQKQKFSLIQNQIEKETDKLNSLASALQKATNEFGENSVEVQKAQNAYDKQATNVDKLKVGANETTTYINKLTREIKNNDSALDEIKKGTRDAATGLKKVGDEAKGSASDLDDASTSAKSMGDAFSGAFAGGALSQMASDLAGSIKDVAEESKDYLKIMGALETSSESLGYTNGQTMETYMQLYGILADDQTAATTTSNLQALGLSQEKLTILTEGAIGAWARYGDSIPIDSLAESINETAQVGKVTGSFADVLNWAGTNEDEFNKKLQSANSTSERANIILDELSKQGLTNSAEAFRENNEALVESNIANAEMQDTMSELAEKVMPILTKITEGLNFLAEMFMSLPEPIQIFLGVLTAVIAILGMVAPIILAITASVTAFNISIAPIAAVVLAIVAAITAAILIFQNWGTIVEFFSNIWGEFTSWIQSSFENAVNFISGIIDNLSDFWDSFTKLIRDLFNIAIDFVKEKFERLVAPFVAIGENIKGVFSGIINFINGVFSGNWSSAWDGIKQVFSNIISALGEIFKAPINFIIDNINSVIDGINGIEIPDWVPVIGGAHTNIPKIPRLKVGMDFVPNDFFPAFLDYGEAVLTKEENKKFRSMGGIDGMQSLYENAINPRITKSAYQLIESREIIVSNPVYLDGKKISDNTTKHVTQSQKNRAFQLGV